LIGDSESEEDRASVIVDLREAQIIAIDEALKRFLVSGPCDADKVDAVSEFFCCFLDRGSF